jgi:hypothetical protein
LGKFYEAMPDLVDGLVETYMGRNGIFGEVDKEQEVYMDKDPLAYMKALRSYVDDTRKDLPQDSEIQNLIDGITDLINTTIYKLELRRDLPEVNCGACKFFLANQKFGMCQRYPEYVMKQDTQWCGEFQSKAIIEEPKKRRKNDPAIARPDSSQAD